MTRVHGIDLLAAALDLPAIAAPSNSIMPETPVENVWTLFDAIREFEDQRRR